MSYVSSILGTGTSTTTNTNSSSTSSLGLDSFLQLLVTQLEYQDPLDPMDDKEFVAELAQFSSLEQLTEINTGIDNLTSVAREQEMIGAVNFMGKTIEATGTAVSLSDGDATPVTFTLGEDASTCIVNVLDSSGEIVRTVDLGATAAGSVEFSWDGKDYDGNTMDDGLYQIAVTATNDDGDTLTVSSTMTGTVTGLEQIDGTYYLNIGDDRYVEFTDITNVVDTTSSSKDADTTSSSKDESSESSSEEQAA